jgi:hypothetical protein
MTFAFSMLDDDALRATGDGFELDVHLNWYRSLPLSSVTTVDLAVNGHEVPRDQIIFSLGGIDSALDDLAARWEETWFVLDPATLKVRLPLVVAGETADVRVRLGSRVPYILIAPDRALESVTERSATLVAK